MAVGSDLAEDSGQIREKGAETIIQNFQCVNISSKDPKALADFYRRIGAPVFVENDRYDGWNIGDPERGGYVCCWDENAWGTSAAGFVTIVLNSDDVQKTYEELKAKGLLCR